MRNSIHRAGVYTIMLRLPFCFACVLALSAQPYLAQSAPQQDPIDAAVQAYWKASSGSGSGEGSVRREELRALLQHVPADSPHFSNWVAQVSQMYQIAGWPAKSRAVLQESLDRASALGEFQPARIGILRMLSDSWRQDGNLLKALSYLEQAAAAQAAAPPVPAAPPSPGAPRFQASVSRLMQINGRAVQYV